MGGLRGSPGGGRGSESGAAGRPSATRPVSPASGGAAEAAAAELAVLDQPDEERVKLVERVVLRLPQARDGGPAEAPEHLEPFAQDLAERHREALSLDRHGAAPRQAGTVAGEGRRRRPRQPP